MTEELFIGGPHAGWHETGNFGYQMLYPKPITFERMFSTVEDPLDIPDPGIGRYTRRRFRHPGWRIPLTIWTCDEEMSGPEPVIPRGIVLPGAVYGRRLEASELCPECFREWHPRCIEPYVPSAVTADDMRARVMQLIASANRRAN